MLSKLEGVPFPDAQLLKGDFKKIIVFGHIKITLVFKKKTKGIYV